MFRKFISLCLSVVLFFSMGVVAKAEEEELEQMWKDLCVVRCKEMLCNRRSLEKAKRAAAVRTAELGLGPWPEWVKNPTAFLNVSLRLSKRRIIELQEELHRYKEEIKKAEERQEIDERTNRCDCSEFEQKSNLCS